MKKIELAREIAQVESMIDFYASGNTKTDDVIEKEAQRLNRKYDKEGLETELAAAEKQLAYTKARATKEARIKEFSNSEAGKSLRNRLHDDRIAWMEDAFQQALTTVQEVLGDDWTIADWGSTGFRVGMKNHDTDPRMALRTTQFGQEFDVNYGYEYDRHDKQVFEFKANVGTCGAFDIADGDSQLAFYVGVGKFLASPKVQVELRDELKQCCDNIKEMQEAYQKAEDEYVNKAA